MQQKISSAFFYPVLRFKDLEGIQVKTMGWERAKAASERIGHARHGIVQ